MTRAPILLALALAACVPPPPEITAHLDPEQPRVGDALTVVTEGADGLTLEYMWFLDDVLQPDLTEAYVRASLIRKFQKWKVIVLPFDGDVEGPPVTDSVVVVNTPPVASVTIDPPDPDPGEALTALVTSEDADDDTVSVDYTWLLDGVDALITRPVVPADTTALGELWTVQVVPKDPQDRGEVAEASVVVGGTGDAPVVSSVTLSPIPAYTDSTLVATVRASDPAGAALTYLFSWRIGGLTVREDDNDTFSGTEWFEKGHEVQVGVAASNGVAWSEEVLSEVLVISNSAPTAPGISIDTFADETGQVDLVCSIDTEATDADGDRLTYTFKWTANGATWTGTTESTFHSGDTIPSSKVGTASTWTCAATAVDDEGLAGPAATVSIEL